MLQVLIVELGYVAFHVSEGGLEPRFWLVSMVLGAGSLPVQQVINLLFGAFQEYKSWRMKSRLARNASLSTRQANGGH